MKALKATGQRDRANALGKLRKPSRLVWVVGQIARADPDLAHEAVTAADDAEAATVGAGDIRAVLEGFRAVVARAASAGAALDETTSRASIELALREVLSDPTARRDWALGCLLTMPSERAVPVDELAPRRARRAAEKAAVARLASRTDGAPDGAADAVKPAPETAADRKARKAEEAARAAKRRERDKAVARARKQVAKLSDHRSALAGTVDAARAEVVDLEVRLTELEAEAERARAQLAAHESELAAADAELTSARTDLDALEDQDEGS